EVEQRGPTIAPVDDRIRVDGKRAVEACDRFGEPPERNQRIGAAAVGIDGAERDRPIEADQRLLMAADLRERHAEQPVRTSLRRIERDRLLEQIDAPCDQALLTESTRLAIECLDPGGVSHCQLTVGARAASRRAPRAKARRSRRSATARTTARR